MANNRLYLYDKQKKELFCLAKGNGCGWYTNHDTTKELNDWLDTRDFNGALGNETSIILVDENHKIWRKKNSIKNTK